MRPLASLLIALAIAVAPQTAAAEAPAAIHTLLDLSFAECHNPRALAVGSTGWIYAAGLSGNVCGIAPWGQLMGVIPVPPGPAGVSNIFGALYESRSALYLTDMADYGASHAGRVLVVSPRTGAVRTLTGGLDGPNGIAQDRDRMLFVADSFAGMIYKVNPDTGQRALWTRDPRLATGGFPPLGASGLAFDPSGAYLYVANPGDSAILRIGMRPNGSPGDVEVFARGATDADPELLHGADGLAFDVTGQLWVAADQANEIQVLSPADAPAIAPAPSARPWPHSVSMSPAACIARATCLSEKEKAPRTTTGSARNTRFRRSYHWSGGQSRSGWRDRADSYAFSKFDSSAGDQCTRRTSLADRRPAAPASASRWASQPSTIAPSAATVSASTVNWLKRHSRSR